MTDRPINPEIDLNDYLTSPLTLEDCEEQLADAGIDWRTLTTKEMYALGDDLAEMLHSNDRAIIDIAVTNLKRRRQAEDGAA